jgi:hypothetical protein
VIFVGHAFSLPLEPLDVGFRQQFFERVEVCANCTGLITDRRKQSYLHFLLVLQKIFCAFEGLIIFPLKRRANCDVRIEEAGLGHHCMNRKQSTERMAGENSIRLNSIFLFDLGNEFSLKELQ